ncbi:hypothetical protein AX777_18425 [Sphingobium yanoikuyae]|uniref:Bacteriophage T5 Orf172 DNA-binding domain-containing protein n=1 Tax=Sphingobium yanoikuyae TaxID=13690 RepID=A0A177JRK4_SPHYA|nr:GIY-YIG nuclease family protein [Sphingobium yanoikuyae]OAH43793.1 hypothetical protein AX777_18425 [Sphingobium yanoikuyae]
MADMTDDDILAELGVDLTPKKVRARTPREERIIAGFEDIVKFREEHGRVPQHGEDRDIFERLYAVRLDRLRALPDCRDLLVDMDVHGLLDGVENDATSVDELDDSALLAELGIEAAAADDITQLRNVRSNTERKAAEEIAEHTPCADFDQFRSLFAALKRDLDGGVRETRTMRTELTLAEIKPGEFFIVGGQLAHIASDDGEFTTDYGRTDRRLRVIYDNETESNVLARSFQKALYRDKGARRVSNPLSGPLFADHHGTPEEPEHLPSGTLYVLRSRSTHPTIAAHRELIHKIGITGGSVEARISGAADDATYLLADVDVVAIYKLFDINRPRLEALIHRVLDSVRFDAEIPDRFGKPVRPREWFLVPLHIIDEIVERIGNGSLAGLTYDPHAVALIPEMA